jgi:hypothetical protein
MSNKAIVQSPKNSRVHRIQIGAGVNAQGELVGKWSEPDVSQKVQADLNRISEESKAPEPELSIAHQAMNCIHQEYEMLRTMVGELEQRLDPICSQSSEDGARPAPEAVESWPPYFASMREIAYGFQTLRVRMDSLLGRLGLE